MCFAVILDPHSATGLPFKLSFLGSTEAPIMLSFLVVSGLRATFNVPSEIEANWIFQLTSGKATNYLSAVRKWVFVRRIIPIYAVIAILEYLFYSPAIATSHVVFDLVLSGVLIELFFFNFNKVPFTCCYPRDKFRLAALSIGYMYGFIAYYNAMGVLKRWAASGPGHFVIFLAGAALILLMISLLRRFGLERSTHIIFRDTDSPGPLSISGDQGYWTVRPLTTKSSLSFGQVPPPR